MASSLVGATINALRPSPLLMRLDIGKIKASDLPEPVSAKIMALRLANKIGIAPI